MQWVEGALLCSGLLASAVLASRPTPAALPCIALGFGMMTAACVAVAPSSGFMGLWLAGCTAWALRPAAGPGLAVAAGSCAALAAACGSALGLGWPAGAIAVTIPLLTAWYARGHGGFAPAGAADEALCGLMLAAVVLAAANTVADGWHTALALNRGQLDTPAASAPLWAWIAVSLALAAGLARGIWKRR